MTDSCDVPLAFYHAQPLRPGGLTLQQAMIATGAICTALTIAMCYWLVYRHVAHFSSPCEQKHLARICALPAIFALFHIFGIIFYNASRYLDPFPKFFEAIALCSLWELYIIYATPSESEHFQEHLGCMVRPATNKSKRRGGVLLRIQCILVYQFPIVTLACLIATLIVSARTCILSQEYRISLKIIRLVQVLATILALTQLIVFHVRNRRELKGKQAIRKLLAIKVLALVVILETVLFSFLTTKVVGQRQRASFFDITIGVPGLLICTEMVLFSLLWLFVFGLGAIQRHHAIASMNATAAMMRVLNIRGVGTHA